MTRQITITIETNSLLILRGISRAPVWCPRCAAEEEMITLQIPNAVPNFDWTAFGEWLDSGELHCLQSPDGSPMVCLNSLLARVQCTKPANCGSPQLRKTGKERT